MFILRAFPGPGCRGRCGAYRASASYAIKLRHHEGNFDGISADRRQLMACLANADVAR
jgi:hypothetical protein